MLNDYRAFTIPRIIQYPNLLLGDIFVNATQITSHYAGVWSTLWDNSNVPVMRGDEEADSKKYIRCKFFYLASSDGSLAADARTIDVYAAWWGNYISIGY